MTSREGSLLAERIIAHHCMMRRAGSLPKPSRAMIVLIAVVAAVVDTSAATIVVLPCSSANATFDVYSNSSYVLSNCSMPPNVDPFVTLNTLGDIIENITIRVVGGTVLPLLRVTAPALRVERIQLSLHDVHVGPHIYTTMQPTLSMFTATSVSLVSGVAVVLNDSTIALTMVSTAGVTMALVFQVSSATTHGTWIEMFNTSIYLLCIYSEAPMRDAKVAFIGTAGNTDNTTVRLSQSMMVLSINMSTVSATISLDAAIYSAACAPAGSCNVTSTVFLASNASILSAECAAAGASTNASGTLVGNGFTSNIVLVSGARWLHSLRVDVGVGTSATARSVCTQTCDVSAVGGNIASSVLMIDGDSTDISVTELIVFVVEGAHLNVHATRTSNIMRATELRQLESLQVNITASVIVMSNSGQSIGLSSRDATVVAVRGATIVSGVSVRMSSVRVAATSESGGCVGASATLVYLVGNTQRTTIVLTNTSLTAAIANGTAMTTAALGFSVAVSALNVALISITSTVTSVNAIVKMLHCDVAAELATSLSPSALLSMIVTLVAAFASSGQLVDSVIDLVDIHVTRRASAAENSATWFPATFNGMRENVTAVAVLVSVMSGAPAELASIVNVVNAGGPSILLNVTTTLTNCTVGYDLRIAPVPTDAALLLILPTTLNRSKVFINTSAMFPERAHQSAFGALVGCVGGALVQDSSITVQRVPTGSLSLISVDSSNMSITGSSTIIFNFVSIDATNTLTASPAVVGGGTMLFDANSTALLSISKCEFYGFSALLAPSSVQVNDGALQYTAIFLGCNLWNGVPLLSASIGYDAAILPHIAYPPSAFNASTTCAGLRPSGNTEATVSVSLRARAPLPLAVGATAEASVAVLVYAMLVPAATTIGRSAVPGLQRAVAVLRLAARCVAATDDTNGSQSPMFSQLEDNPLNLKVPVGADALSYSAGASVGNMLLVCTVAALLHSIHVVQRVRASSKIGAAASVVRRLPSSPFPGSVAAIFGRLLQPAVGACIAMITSIQRTGSSVACGVVMLLLWVAYPAYCVAAVVWHGRRVGRFVLVSNAIIHQPRRGRTACVPYATSETHEWSPHPGCAGRGTPERRYAEFLLHKLEAVFAAFVGHREWYFAVEWAITAVSGGVLGAAQAASMDGDACYAAQWGTGSAISLSLLQLWMCLWLQPFSVRCELWMSVLLGILELLSNIFSLAGLVDYADVVVSISTYIELTVAVAVALLVRKCWQPAARLDHSFAPATIPMHLSRDVLPLALVKQQRSARGASRRHVAGRHGAATHGNLYIVVRPQQLAPLIRLICRKRGSVKAVSPNCA